MVLTLGACGVFGFWKNLVISAFSALMRCGGEGTGQHSYPTALWEGNIVPASSQNPQGIYPLRNQC